MSSADKLLDLEFIWSRITLEEPTAYSPLPYAAENTRIYLFDYGPMINEKITGAGMGYLPFYRVFPEYSYTVDGAARHDYDRTVNGNEVKSDGIAPILNIALSSNTNANKYPYIAHGVDMGAYPSSKTPNGSWLTQRGSLQYLFDPTYNAAGYINKDTWAANIRADSRAGFYNPYTHIGITNVNTTKIEDSTAGTANSAYRFRRAYLPVSNNGSGTGLFQKDAEGYWYYDSGMNAAWYNPATEKFELYNYTVIPGHEAFDNYGGTSNGNFLPFNLGHVEGLTDYQTKESKVQASNGNVIWNNRVTANVGDTVDGYPLLRENFRLQTQNRTNSVNLNFGMVVEFDFYMPRDGMIDGKPMEFIFKGDDDVWVFIDDVLVLDIGGCHGAESASINFHTGALTPPDSDAGYYKGTSLRQMYELAGASTASFKENSSTFANYTKHTLKFYYIERGGNVSFCRLRFNMPQIPQETVSVNKELASDVQPLGNPDYYFSIMALDDDNVTRRLFLGRTDDYAVIKKTKYRILNPDGTYMKNTDGTELFSTDEYGIFKIKAGQTAIFEGVPATNSRFYIQEMIKEEDLEQYMIQNGQNFTSDIMVNDGRPIWQGQISWDGRGYFSNTSAYNPYAPEVGPYGYVWYGASGPITDAASDTGNVFFFNHQNGVYEDKLASLSITKAVTVNPSNFPAVTGRYQVCVELDGAPLPEGTTYTVGSETRTVGFDTDGNSYVELAAGETATLVNILSGTQFRIWEAEASAKGHTVTYSNLSSYGNGENIVSTSSGITGIVRVDDHVRVRVNNVQYGTSLNIPVTKSFASYSGGPYTCTFSLTEMVPDGNGGYQALGDPLTKDVQFTGAAAQTFTLASVTYYKQEFDSFPAVKYYMIEETGETAPMVDNTKQYLVVVTVTENSRTGAITANITNILERPTADGTWADNGAANVAFVNTLTGSLTVTKTVSGSSIATPQTGFTFTLTVAAGSSGTVPTQFLAVKTAQSGTVTQETVTSTSYTFQLKHGETMVFSGLPIGTAWTVTETNYQGFLSSWTVGNVTSEEASASGTITLTDTAASCTNTATYELPNTGGPGTLLFTLSGLVLSLTSAAWLTLRRKRKD